MKIHFIAVGGTGMGALACMMKAAGHDVRGSDGPIYPPMSSQLERAGVITFEGFSAENLEWGPDVVVVGNVCSKEHVEVLAAREAGLRLESFPSLLEQTLLAERTPIVVSGTHGKTTTTSMVTWLLLQGGLSPSWLVGGVPRNLGHASHLGEGEHFVIEGDEYDTAFFDKKSKFLHYRPQVVILTSLEFDHADIFADMDEIRAAFAELLALVPEGGLVIVNAADPEADALVQASGRRSVRYQLLGDGEAPGAADLEAKMVRSGASRTASISHFEVYESGTLVGTFQSTTLGAYNIANLLASMAAARHAGVSWEKLQAAVPRFRGVKRRQELIGIAQGVRVIEDFAHHPTAVSMTVEAIRRRYPDKSLRVAFEPRSATSRRKVLFADFVKAFDAATAVYLGPLHAPEKIPESERLDTGALADAISGRGVAARDYQDIDSLMAALIEQSVPGDTLLVLS
ncbi:MAG: UDP-N-acetylmuramate--L-alanine ligase, partial [Nannocystaceae bacterium]